MEQLLKDTLIAYWPPILSSLIIVAIALVILTAFKRGLGLVEKMGRLDPSLMATFMTMGRWLVIIGAGAALLQTWNIIENVWTTLTGVLALVAIGFVAVWSILSHALCSVILLLSRPFRVGDYIEFVGDDFGGRVKEVNLLYTTVTMDDGGYAQIPNNMVFQKVLKRYPHGKPETKDEEKQ